jgi:putative Holliday junction resolvase
MRTGVRLGLDVGTVRIGVARSDVAGILATPLATLQRGEGAFLSSLVDLCEELSVVEVIVGLPLALSGSMTASTRDALDVATTLQANISVPVRLIDERLTTVSAHSALRLTGKKQRTTRSVIDQVAAVMILQQALDSEKSTGLFPGKLIADIQD